MREQQVRQLASKIRCVMICRDGTQEQWEPMSLYMSKHTTNETIGKPTSEDEFNGKESVREFGRALGELEA